MMGWLQHCQELISKRSFLLSRIDRYALFPEVREENYIKGALEHLREWEVGARSTHVMQYDTSHCDTK